MAFFADSQSGIRAGLLWIYLPVAKADKYCCCNIDIILPLKIQRENTSVPISSHGFHKESLWPALSLYIITPEERFEIAIVLHVYDKFDTFWEV